MVKNDGKKSLQMLHEIIKTMRMKCRRESYSEEWIMILGLHLRTAKNNWNSLCPRHDTRIVLQKP